MNAQSEGRRRRIDSSRLRLLAYLTGVEVIPGINDQDPEFVRGRALIERFAIESVEGHSTMPIQPEAFWEHSETHPRPYAGLMLVLDCIRENLLRFSGPKRQAAAAMEARS